MKLNLKKLSESKANTGIVLYATTLATVRTISQETGWPIQKIFASAVNTFIDAYDAEQTALAEDADYHEAIVTTMPAVGCTCHADKVCGYCQIQKSGWGSNVITN